MKTKTAKITLESFTSENGRYNFGNLTETEIQKAINRVNRSRPLKSLNSRSNNMQLAYKAVKDSGVEQDRINEALATIREKNSRGYIEPTPSYNKLEKEIQKKTGYKGNLYEVLTAFNFN